MRFYNIQFKNNILVKQKNVENYLREDSKLEIKKLFEKYKS